MTKNFISNNTALYGVVCGNAPASGLIDVGRLRSAFSFILKIISHGKEI